MNRRFGSAGSGSYRFIVNRDESDIRFSRFWFIPVQIHAGSRGESQGAGAQGRNPNEWMISSFRRSIRFTHVFQTLGAAGGGSSRSDCDVFYKKSKKIRT